MDQNAHRAQVEDLVDVHSLALHLPPDAEDVLGPATDLGLDSGLGELGPQQVHDPGDVGLTLVAAPVQELGDTVVLVRLEVAQGQVLQLPFDLPDTQAIGQGGVDTLGIQRDFASSSLIQILDAAHEVQAFGEHDQDDPHVLRDTEQ